MFWWNFVFSSNFGQNLQNHKTGFQWIWTATVLSRGGALPPEQSRLRARRHAPGHAAAWLREPAVMWTSPPPACSSTPLLLPLHGRSASPFSADTDDPAAPSKFIAPNPSQAQLSHLEHSPPPCEPSAPPSSLPSPLNRRNTSLFSNSGRNRRRGTPSVATWFQ